MCADTRADRVKQDAEFLRTYYCHPRINIFGTFFVFFRASYKVKSSHYSMSQTLLTTELFTTQSLQAS